MSYSDFEAVQYYGSQVRSVFPDEILNGDRGFARGPERSLMSALLFDAIQAYVNYTCGDRASPRSRYREAYDWINLRGGDYVFSFENVCEGLGINPDCLRLGLANACVSEMRKTRKNF